MAMVTITADSSTKIFKNLSLQKNNTPDDASLASFFNGAEETFVLQLSESSRNLNSISSIPHESPHSGRKKTEYGEIDVFSAEKYFNETAEEGMPKSVSSSAQRSLNKKTDPLDMVPVHQKAIPPGTPSIRSESSRNSRSSLLHIPQNRIPKNANNTRSKSFLASLVCNCSCSDKDSVDVDNYTSTESKTRKPIIANRFPVFGLEAGNPNQLHFQEKDLARRQTLEVFGSPIMMKADKISTLEGSFAMLAWDAIPPREVEIEIPADSNGKYKDTDSDASSDLFEIESFSTNTNPCLARQASDGMSSCVTETACYAPSEASIEWSTVTASAADFSVISDSEETNTIMSFSAKTSLHKKVLDKKNRTGREMTSRRPSILSGCKSHKSVRVAGEAYRTSDKAFAELQREQKLGSLTATTRFHNESKMMDFETRNGQHRLNTLALAETQIKRAPHLLHMH